MRVETASVVGAALLLSALSSMVDAATLYTSQELTPSSARKYIDLSNEQRVLTMRQDSPAAADLHIVIEEWTEGGINYSEFRPGTLPGSTRSIATGFNDVGRITGYAETADANGNIYAPDGFALRPPRAFVTLNGKFLDLSKLPPLRDRVTTASAGTAINERGQVAGYWTDATGTHGFRYENGVITDLGSLPGSFSTQPVAINASGQVTGTAVLPPGPFSGAPQVHGFLYNNGTMTDLGVIPGYDSSFPTAMNNAGDVVGIARVGNHAISCFIYRGGVITNMGVIGLAGPFPVCHVNQINNAGVAVGSANVIPTATDPGNLAAFVYENGQMTNLNSVISPQDGLLRDNIRLRDAIAISEQREIIASAPVGEVLKFYLLTPLGADVAQYKFEGGTQQWQSTGEPIITVSASNVRPYAGAQSLAVQFNDGGFASVAVATPPVPAGRLVRFHVYLPADALFDWIQPFVLEGLDHGWRWSGNYRPIEELKRGAWNTIRVRVPENAGALWSLGVEFYASHPYTGTAYVDSVGY